MVRLSRKLYKRRHSWEVTIPMPIISTLERHKRFDTIFKFDNKAKKWLLTFSEHKKVKKHEKEGIRRHIYVRGSSFATTIPLPLLLHLGVHKKLHAHFTFDPKIRQWSVEVENG